MTKCTLKNVNVFAAKHEAFDCNGTLEGKWMHHAPLAGMMSDSDQIKAFDSMFHDMDDVYVIRSYNTPIAAWNNRDGWWVSKEGYTTTTKRHFRALNIN